MYYDAEVARVNAEMVRPTAATRSDGVTWGGFDLDLLDIAGLARAVQARMYVHKISAHSWPSELGKLIFFICLRAAAELSRDYSI